MNTTKQGILNKKRELAEKKIFSRIISDWAGKNKKVFWKYEVSCFYKTYKIKINNLPEPSEKDILLSSNNRLLSDEQKKQLCDALIKACAGTEGLSDSSIDVKLDYVEGAVIAEVIH